MRGPFIVKIYPFILGLRCIARNGDTSFKFENDTITMSANIGMGASKAGYSASAEFQGLAKVSASIDVKIYLKLLSFLLPKRFL